MFSAQETIEAGMIPLSQDFFFEFGVVESVAVESLQAQ
jgi:hypothetical protein